MFALRTSRTTPGCHAVNAVRIAAGEAGQRPFALPSKLVQDEKGEWTIKTPLGTIPNRYALAMMDWMRADEAENGTMSRIVAISKDAKRNDELKRLVAKAKDEADWFFAQGWLLEPCREARPRATTIGSSLI